MIALFLKIFISLATFLFSSFSWQANTAHSSFNFITSVFNRRVLEQLAVFNKQDPALFFSQTKQAKEKIGPELFGSASQPLLVEANSCVAIDMASSATLFAQDAEKTQAIASITKLMTALVFLDNNPGWDKKYTMQKIDKRDGQTSFYAGDEVSVKDLFYGMLVASDNTAVIGLVHSAGFSEDEFVAKMNKKAGELGLIKTNFADPTGLNNNNISNALEVANFAREALKKTEIQEVVLAEKYGFETSAGEKRNLKSTDQLLASRGHDLRIIGGKTGYLESAGYCFVGQFAKDKNEILTVVLGAPTITARFSETKKIIDWVYDNYKWKTIIKN